MEEAQPPEAVASARALGKRVALMKLTITNILKSLIGITASIAVVAAVVFAAAGGHADHPATEDRAGQVERQARGDREAVMTNSGPRFRTQEPYASTLPGGGDPREE